MPITQLKKHILMLGASSKLGRMLRKYWAQAQPDQLVFHWQFRKNAPAGDVTWAPGRPPPADLPPIDAIVALWGITPGENRDLGENSALARDAVALGAALGVDRVLHCSTAAVYEPGPAPLAEGAAGGAVNPYGAAKLDMEQAIATLAGPAQSCVLRIANVAGADSLFAALSRDAGAVTLDQFADGTGPVRSYISPPTLARVIETLATCPRDSLPGLINVAAPTPIAMADIAAAAGREVQWTPAPPTAAALVRLDTGLLQRLVPLPEETATDLVAAWHRYGVQT